MKKGTKLYSMLKMKCPRCQKGNLFYTGSFSFRRPFDMKESCPNCGQRYTPEPGFYYGAMFISYGLFGWFSLGLVGFCMLVMDMSVRSSVALLVVLSVILYAWVFRIARSIWLSLNVKYQPDIAKKVEKE